jgi:hypothetical protein
MFNSSPTWSTTPTTLSNNIIIIIRNSRLASSQNKNFQRLDEEILKF